MNLTASHTFLGNTPWTDKAQARSPTKIADALARSTTRTTAKIFRNPVTLVTSLVASPTVRFASSSMEAIMRNSISQLVIGTAVAIGLAVVSVGAIGSAGAGERASVNASPSLVNRFELPVSDVDKYNDFNKRRTEQREDT